WRNWSRAAISEARRRAHAHIATVGVHSSRVAALAENDLIAFLQPFEDLRGNIVVDADLDRLIDDAAIGSQHLYGMHLRLCVASGTAFACASPWRGFACDSGGRFSAGRCGCC